VTIVLQLAYFIVFLFFLALLGRLVLDWVLVFARDWKPRGVVLVIAESIYTVTDPPLKALRRLIPPVRIGAVQLDLAFLVLFLIVVLLMNLLR
jgi:YggT family protein